MAERLPVAFQYHAPMTPPAWLRRHFTPAPDSAAAGSIRRGKSPWTDGIHLLWSLWVFLTPMFGGGYSLRWLVLTAVSYPLFVWLYVKAIVGPRRLGWRYALAMAALSLVLLRWYPSGLSYFVFGCVMLRVSAQRVRYWQYALQLLAMNLVYVGVAAWIGYPPSLWLWVPVMTFVIGTIINVEHASQEKDAALALSHEEVRRLAALAERERIGRDLHDLLGHTLSMVALKADLAARLVERDAVAAQGEIGAVAAIARDALAQVRAAVSGIRNAGIAAELASARLLLETDGVAFDYALDERFAAAALPAAVESALAMTVREAATNIQRHARAQRATMRFSLDGGDAVLQVEDDGCGGAPVAGNGLTGMRERVEALGGRLRLVAAGACGLRIEARVPLREAGVATSLGHDADVPARIGAAP